MTETVFAWPGIGRLMFEALEQRDYNLLLGIFFSAALVIVFNIITDLVYSLADPRIKKGPHELFRTLRAKPWRPGGLIILLVIIAMAILAPLLFPESPWRMVQRPFCPRSQDGFPWAPIPWAATWPQA
ncbi:hypothetical protein HORIV_09950 [Vreelandella olivaria]|uniref:ABC transmembrane type-1 domain-containing protein n=1 Tax=Vreelandella olivaria TaxID=390919 RepID=A0ABM7GDJ0_9GAMM|nr:hypothetical protein HORIV_09950 [Halomonas olivaria]